MRLHATYCAKMPPARKLIIGNNHFTSKKNTFSFAALDKCSIFAPRKEVPMNIGQ